jgi:hypothetical protein
LLLQTRQQQSYTAVNDEQRNGKIVVNSQTQMTITHKQRVSNDEPKQKKKISIFGAPENDEQTNKH